MICRNCEAEIEDGEKVCRWCGTETPYHPKTKEQRTNKISLKYILLICSGVVIVIIVLIAVLSIFLQDGGVHAKNSADALKDNVNQHTSVGGVEEQAVKNEDDDNKNLDAGEIKGKSWGSVFYIKNSKELMFSMLDHIKPQRLGDASSDRYSSSLNSSEDGTKVIYNSNTDGVGNSYVFQPNNLTNSMALFCDLTDGKVNKFKIGKDIDSCVMNKTSNKFYYLANFKHLFFSNLNKIEDIDDSVIDYYISENGDTVLYSKDAYSLYLKKEGKKKQYIASDASLQYATKDLKEIYYTNEQNLCLFKNGQTAVVGCNVNYIVSINEKGQVYYITVKYDKPSDDSDSEVSGEYSLYYYEQGSSTLVMKYHYAYSDSYSQPENSVIEKFDSPDNKPIIVFLAKQVTKKGKDKESKNKYTTYICKGDTVIGEFKQEGEDIFNQDVVKEKLYYQSSKTNILYYITITGDGVSEPVQYMDNVYKYELYGDDVVVYKNVKSNDQGDIGDLYINNKLIDHNVDLYSAERDENSKLYTYDKNYNESTMIYDGVKVKKLGDGISVCKQFDGNKIVYIKMNVDNVGKLYLYDGSGEDKLIDDGVTEVIDANHGGYGYTGYME